MKYTSLKKFILQVFSSGMSFILSVTHRGSTQFSAMWFGIIILLEKRFIFRLFCYSIG